jgi:hypothetical protein
MRIVAICALTGALLAAQARDTRPPQSDGPSTLAGRVVAAATLQPIRMAHVVLIGTATGTRRLTATDDDGRYQFSNLPADQYRVGVSRPPFLAHLVGTRGPGITGPPIDVAAGAVVTAPEVQLIRGGAIEGTVYSADGRPQAGVNVAAVGVRLVAGVRVLRAISHGLAITDLQGRFRLHGLTPGAYLVAATPRRISPEGIRLNDDVVDRAMRGEITVPTMEEVMTLVPQAPGPMFAPGTVHTSHATLVTVDDGTEIAGVQVQLPNPRGHRVAGRIVDSRGQPTEASVDITGLGWPRPLAFSVRGQGKNGTFNFGNLPAGRYRLEARSTSSAELAFVDLVVDGIDHANMIVTLRPPLTLSGRLDAANMSSLPQTFVVRSLIDDRDTTVFLRADGSFTSPALAPGTYVLVAPGLTHARIGASDITDRLFDVTEPIADIAMTVEDHVQTLVGRITDDSGIGIGGSTLVLFSTAEAHWHDRSRRVEAVDTDIEGRFRFGGPGDAILPAGDYFLAVVTRLLPDEQYDPAFLRSLIPSAIRLSLAPGQRMTQDVKVR